MDLVEFVQKLAPRHVGELAFDGPVLALPLSITISMAQLMSGDGLMHVTIEKAEAAIKAARIKAQTIKTQMCIAIVDSGANLKAFYRMDDAWVGSIDISIKKAKTAVFFGMPTGAIGQLSQPGAPLFGIEQSNDGLITFPGGLPIVDEDGVLMGAIGVSGSSVEHDHEVAQAGVDVLGVAELPAHPWRT